MKRDELEIFRIDILRVLDANPSGWGINLHVITVHLQPYGFTPEKAELLRELQYLQDKGFATVPSKALSPENKTWRITAEGRDLLAQHA